MKFSIAVSIVAPLVLASSSFESRLRAQESVATPGVEGSAPAMVEGVGSQMLGMGLGLPSRARGGSPMSRLPLTFVANEGQWDSPALFVAQQGALTLSIERGGLAICTRGGDADGDVVTAVRLVFEGASDSVFVEGRERAPGLRNYYLGNDPALWRTGVAAFQRVVYTSLYGGIDLQLRESEGLPEYDFVLLPGADLSQIRVRCEGVESMCIDADGKLQIDTAAGPLHQSPPTTWYELASGERRLVECRFELLGERTYGFRIDGRDESLPLVVDPGLTWSTFYGGSNDDICLRSCVDPSGRLALAGSTKSANLPGALGNLAGTRDGFVAVLDSTQSGISQLVWSTYVGGSSIDLLFGIASDAAGQLYATGCTISPNFPTTGGAYDTSANGSLDAVVMEFDPVSGAIVYSSYFGGDQHDWGVDIGVLAPHVVTISGVTFSPGASTPFPITVGAFQPTGGSRDQFVARLALNGAGANDLVYSTFLGGSGYEGGAIDVTKPWEMIYQAMALDGAGDVYLTGITTSVDFPVTTNAYQPALFGQQDAFVIHLRPQGNGSADLVYSTYLGGAAGAWDGGLAVVVDAAGVISVGGFTWSSDFPTTPGCFDSTFEGVNFNDAFIARFDPSQPPSSQLLYSTFLGGQGWDPVRDLVADGAGGLIVCGETGDGGYVNSFPITCNALQPAFLGGEDGYLVHLIPNGNGLADLAYSTFVGGTNTDALWNVHLVGAGSTLRVIATGLTLSGDFPTLNAFQPTFGGGLDSVACEILIPPAPGPYCTAGTTTNGCVPSIAGIGNASASAGSGFTLVVKDTEGQQNGLIFYGLSGQVANPWGLGTSFMCVKSPLERMTNMNAGGTFGACDGVLSIDWNLYIATHSGALGCPFTGGETVFAQGWFRDPPAPKTTNLSDALTFVVCP